MTYVSICGFCDENEVNFAFFDVEVALIFESRIISLHSRSLMEVAEPESAISTLTSEETQF